MRPTTEHHRKLITFLRDVYQANDVRLVRGGKCPKLTFRYRGESFAVPMGIHAARDPRAADNSRALLRRLLGPPPAPQGRPHRALEETTSEVAE